MLIMYFTKPTVYTLHTISSWLGRSQTFQNEGAARGTGGRLGLKMAALHRPLYKVSFYFGAQGGLGF